MQQFNVRRAFPLVTFLLAFAAACGGDDPMEPSGGGGGGGGGGGTPVATTSVTLTTSFTFDPADIVVSPGATVTWTWANSTTHNVTFADGSITSSGNQSGGTFSTAMPTTAGTYNYQCTIHAGMNGSVKVE